MSKIFSKYENDLDRVWYDSSNILYSECDDNTDALKTVRITFKNGSTYQYTDVKVQDYLMFRDAVSNGSNFFKYIKNHDFVKLENKDVDDLKNELALLLEENEKENE